MHAINELRYRQQTTISTDDTEETTPLVLRQICQTTKRYWVDLEGSEEECAPVLFRLVALLCKRMKLTQTSETGWRTSVNVILKQLNVTPIKDKRVKVSMGVIEAD